MVQFQRISCFCHGDMTVELIVSEGRWFDPVCVQVFELTRVRSELLPHCSVAASSRVQGKVLEMPKEHRRLHNNDVSCMQWKMLHCTALKATGLLSFL